VGFNVSDESRDTGYSYEGKVSLRDRDRRLTVFDVDGFLYARTREEAAWQVAKMLLGDISSSQPLGEDERPAGYE
jgi:hypothetical protein